MGYLSSEMMIEKYNKIKFRCFHGYNVGDMLTLLMNLADCIEGKDITLKTALKAYLVQILYEHYEYETKISQDTHILGYTSYHGSHHRKTFESVAKLDAKMDYIAENQMQKRINLIRSFKVFVNQLSWFWSMRKCGTTIKHALWLNSYLSHVYDFKIKVMDRIIDFDKYNLIYTFYDLEPVQNLLIQKAKLFGIKTATLQHGAGFYAGDVEAQSVSDLGIEFRKSISDYMLVWNSFAQKEGIKCGVPKNKLVVSGIPKFIGLRSEDRAYNFEIKQKVFGVILDITSWGNEQNIKMLRLANEIAEKNQMYYIVRYHPTSKRSEYDNIIDKRYLKCICKPDVLIEDFANQVDFSIVDGSSVLVELIYLHSVAFRYRFSENDKFAGVSINSVDCYEELQSYLDDKEKVIEGCKKLFDIYCTVDDARKGYYSFFSCYM